MIEWKYQFCETHDQNAWLYGRENSMRFGIKGTEALSCEHVFYFLPPVMFVNIQKNASSAVRDAILAVQNHIIPDKSEFWFAVVRDPLQRFRSTMKFLVPMMNTTVQDLGNRLQGRDLVFDQQLDTFGNFVHFAPQWMHVRPFIDSKQPMNYFDIRDIAALEHALTGYFAVSVSVPISNASRQNRRLDNEIDHWVDCNRVLVNQYLSQDYDWLSSITIER